MSKLVCSLLLLYSLPAVVPLFCYTCVCLSSRAVGEKGDFLVVLYEKSCVLPSLCGAKGEKHTMGLNFTFTNECCNTHLCNRAEAPATRYWTGTILTLLISYSVW
ncbi:hypothetical protein JOQ06_025244 [Pogonophryne albipinna]|uniref:UPAR/Ly6 domain-containing protein n=1 Tax=Pogonophryne albipinna TaxID=1090488 RepID=A0AAD6AS67_9TELE|nr:hypothetical protein JOQ06_025244 [Pogonophryne albipinna]